MSLCTFNNIISDACGHLLLDTKKAAVKKHFNKYFCCRFQIKMKTDFDL